MVTSKGFVSGIDRLLLDFASRAVSAARRATEPWDHGGDSITAIILSAAAVEAHVGEWVAVPENKKRLEETEIKRWKEERWPVYEIVKGVLSRLNRPNTGHFQWYKRLRALCELRNLAVHYYPEHRLVGTWPKAIEPYVHDHTIEPAGDDSMDWTSRILVSSVAEQAYCIACDAIRGFDDQVAAPEAGAV